jgi:hypothetical protein
MSGFISADAQIKLADNEKSRLTQGANDYINSKQWPGRLLWAVERSEKVQYNAWLDYLDALEAVNTSTHRISPGLKLA